MQSLLRIRSSTKAFFEILSDTLAVERGTLSAMGMSPREPHAALSFGRAPAPSGARLSGKYEVARPAEGRRHLTTSRERESMSASLIGRFRSSPFKLSTTSVVGVAHGLALLFGIGTEALP